MRLNCVGTTEDLSRQQISLRDGQSIVLYREDLEVSGVVRRSEEENLWVAEIDWDAVRERDPVVSQAVEPAQAHNVVV